jgi:fructose-specific phosphotransferase system IIC component
LESGLVSEFVGGWVGGWVGSGWVGGWVGGLVVWCVAAYFEDIQDDHRRKPRLLRRLLLNVLGGPYLQ